MSTAKVTVYRFQVHSPVTRGWLTGGCHATERFIETVKGRKLEESAIEVDAATLTTEGQYFQPGMGFVKPASVPPCSAAPQCAAARPVDCAVQAISGSPRATA